MNPQEDGRPSRAEALADLSCAIAEPLSQRDLIARMLAVVSKALGADVVSLRLLDAASGELHLISGVGVSSEAKPLRLGESIVGRVTLERRAQLVADIENSQFKVTAYIRDRGLKSLMSAPLLLRDRSLGGITVYSNVLDAWDEDDLALLSAMAGPISAVMENDLLLRDASNTLLNLARAIESKDPYSLGHSERVTAYSVALGEKLGLASEDIRLLKTVAPMHDIGKAGISETILNKPCRLNRHERKAVERHPVIGESIVSSVRSYQPGLFLIRSHHERMDGKGYPDGMCGREIPLLVRALSVCDAFDSMTTRRPYRDPLDRQSALQELAQYAETQFDGQVVDAFIKVANDKKLG